MQAKFKAKGWLGLILGTRLWYGFFDADQDDDATFEIRVDALCNEIGNRGKPKLQEAVPPAWAPASAPAPAPVKAPAPATFEPTLERAPTPTPSPSPPAPAPAPAPTRAPAASDSVPTTPMHALAPVASPSMPLVQHVASTAGGSLPEILAIFKQQREEIEARMDARVKEERVRMAEKDAKIEALKAELTAPPVPAITDEQLAALQARIDGLHAAKLLTDDDLFALEDLVADYVDLTMSVTDGVITKVMIYSRPILAVASKLDTLVGLSAAMAGDAAFARQARRKIEQPRAGTPPKR